MRQRLRPRRAPASDKRALMGDLVVVIPGMLGSRLARRDTTVWDPQPGKLWDAVREFAVYAEDFALPPDTGDEDPQDGIIPLGLVDGPHALPGIWAPQAGYGPLLHALTSTFTLVRALNDTEPGNLVCFAYDWRLSARFNAHRLKRTVEEALDRWRSSSIMRAGAQVRFVCCSTGGLIARYYVECLGGRALTRQVITLGTPFQGSASALMSLANGAPQSMAPTPREALTTFARSLPSLHEALPTYPCLHTPDAATPGLATVTDTDPQGVDPVMVKDALVFHDEMRMAAGAVVGANDLYTPITGAGQPTVTTARWVLDRLVAEIADPDLPEGDGDGCVAQFSAVLDGLAADRVRPLYATHGMLTDHAGIRESLLGALAPEPRVRRGPDPTFPLAVEVPPFCAVGSPVVVTAHPATDRIGDIGLRVSVHVTDDTGAGVAQQPMHEQDGQFTARFDHLAPGGYRLACHAVDDDAATATTALTLVGG